ncbi:Atrial natriuretic peptide receptor 1 [Hypsibius exemplaris]|uniref:guanylate cyclase n=1 Tax=Hypsibius exemplaris TaxID=2072580 RepID=A0A1W0WFP8_HYPEX|nr:Atrial natriuretic peptide receptor 1 [Hypsibius exemplaris]
MLQTRKQFVRGLLLLCCCWSSLHPGCSVRAYNVTFIVCMSYTSLAYSYDYYGPAIDMALRDLNARHSGVIAFQKVNLSPPEIHSCPQLDGKILSLVTDYLFTNETGIRQWSDPDNLNVIIGNGCSDSLRYIGDLARDLNLPVITSGGSGSVLVNNQRFPTMLRLLPYQQSDLVRTLILFMKKFQWQDVSLLCDRNPGLGNFFTLACEGFRDGFLNYGGFNPPNYFPFNTATTTRYDEYLKSAALTSRIFVIVAHGNKTRDIMIEAHRLGMTNGDYVYITTYPLEHPLYGQYRWQVFDDDDDIAKEAFRSLYFVSTRPVRGPDYARFEAELKYRAFFDYNFTYAPDERVSAFTAFQHTVVTLTGEIVRETLSETGQIHNGTKVMEKVFGQRRVKSVTGDFDLFNADRVLYIYVIVGMEHHRHTFREYYEYDTVNRTLLSVENSSITWAGDRASAPPNKPFCDFDGSAERCDTSKQITIGIIVGLVAAAAGILLPGFYLVRKIKQNGDLDNDNRWYVPLDDIVLNTAAASVTTQGSLKTQHRSFAHGSHNSRSEISTVRSQTRTHGTSNNSMTRNAHVARYKDKLVWMRKIVLAHKFSPTRPQELLIKKLKRIHNINIAHFYGMAPHEVELTILCEVVPRGSLSDVMNSDTIKFDIALKNSIINDLTNGMVYLHDSQIGYHGDLSCLTCLMDGRFVLKIAYFRLDFLPYVTPDFLEGDRDYYAFIAFPPEQLRGPVSQIYRGSKEGDVYSYAHVIAQVSTELEPFEKEMTDNNFTAKDILDRVMQNSIIPMRPKLPSNSESCPPLLVDLIEKCWRDKPADRPTFRAVESILKEIPGFKTDRNFVDSLFQRMAAYAEELETRINIATAGLMEEKKKSEELLFQVLPKHLAMALTQGKKIDPELFDSVTIGFTALANFSDIAIASSPMEIVNLLNDLYSMFDATLELYDVYKVETISDSYMIASGIPVRNGEEHSRQIAKVALELVKESASFRIRHRPTDVLQIKVGFHQGKCAAGIVGMKMPRYCLFGDTINTASRMTSFGLALKIQISTAAMEHLKRFNEFRFQLRGLVEIKGKGLQKCYWLLQDHEQEVAEDLEVENIAPP